MKKFITRFLIAMALAAPASMLTSCEEDAPTYAYSLSEMAGAWTWNTDFGDLTEYFGVTISEVSDTKISISNFHNLGKTVDIDVNDKELSFSGNLTSSLEIVNGSGKISNGYQTMSLDYDIYDSDEETTESFHITLNKGEAISKK